MASSASAINEPAVFDLTVVVGNSLQMEFEVLDEAGNPIDLSGKRLQARIFDADRDQILASFIDMNLGADGKISLILPVHETEKLVSRDEAAWALTVVDSENPDLGTTTYVYGKVRVKRLGLPIGSSGDTVASA